MSNGGTPIESDVPIDGDPTGGESHPDDDRLLALLGQAIVQSDPVPGHVTEGARAAFTWRNIDAELAEIVFDSATELAGVRSEDLDRQITFQAPGVEIEVMVVDETSRRLIGQLIPPSEMTVDLVGSDGVATVATDRLGRFTFDEIEPGPVRLVVRDADGGAVVQTEWVLF
ncbi:MAG: hypothetical protein AAFP84_09085 [Actinomycetota bacterium]